MMYVDVCTLDMQRNTVYFIVVLKFMVTHVFPFLYVKLHDVQFVMFHNMRQHK